MLDRICQILIVQRIEKLPAKGEKFKKFLDTIHTTPYNLFLLHSMFKVLRCFGNGAQRISRNRGRFGNIVPHFRNNGVTGILGKTLNIELKYFSSQIFHRWEYFKKNHKGIKPNTEAGVEYNAVHAKNHTGGAVLDAPCLFLSQRGRGKRSDPASIFIRQKISCHFFLDPAYQEE